MLGQLFRICQQLFFKRQITCLIDTAWPRAGYGPYRNLFIFQTNQDLR